MFSYHVLSVFIVENYPIYFKNLLETSYRTGSLPVLINFYMIYFGTIFIMEKNTRYKNPQDVTQTIDHNYIKYIKKLYSKKKIRIITNILLIIIILVLFKKRNVGFYSMNGIDRFDYAALTFSWFDTKFYTYITWLLPIPLLALKLGMKVRGFGFMTLYCFFMIWVGDKFGSLFIGFYIFTLVIWATQKIDKKKFYQIMLLCFIIVSLLMVFISFQVKYQWGSWSDIPTYFAHRLTGGQSDLWWKIYAERDNLTLNFNEFCRDELSALLYVPQNVVDYNFGIYKMMRVTAPASVVSAYLNRGIRFAASTQATLFYYFGHLGLYIGGFILALIGYWIINKSIHSYCQNNILYSICSTMLLAKYISIMQMSEFRFLTNKTTILALFILSFKPITTKLKKIKTCH